MNGVEVGSEMTATALVSDIGCGVAAAPHRLPVPQ